MNSARKFATAGLLILAIAGCAEKKTKVAPAAQAQAPSKDVSAAGQGGAMYPPPLIAAQPAPDATNTPPPANAKAENPPPAPPPQPSAKKPASTRKPKAPKSSTAPSTSLAPTSAESSGDAAAASGSTAAAAAPPTAAQTQAANELAAASGEPAAVSPIGELSTGGAAGQADSHKGTLDLINTTENGVNGIKRTLTAPEQETVSQIKAFLIKAKAAFENNDFDGATTLAVKAKLLLDELNKD